MTMWKLSADDKGGVTARKARVFGGHTGDINTIAFTRTYNPADKVHALTASSDGTARIWRIDPTAAAAAKHSLSHTHIAVTAQSQHGDSTASVNVDVAAVTVSIVLKGHSAQVNAAKFCKNGYVVTCSADRSAVVWGCQGADYTILKRFDGHTGQVRVTADCTVTLAVL